MSLHIEAKPVSENLFAALAPAGSARRFTFTLDPTLAEGSPVVIWINQPNPHCSGDIADP